MEKVVLATPEAWEGIDDFEGRLGCVDAAPGSLAAEAVGWLDLPEPARAPAARAWVRAHHDWARNLDAYESSLGNARPGAVPSDTGLVSGAEAYP